MLASSSSFEPFIECTKRGKKGGVTNRLRGTKDLPNRNAKLQTDHIYTSVDNICRIPSNRNIIIQNH